jgi:hypothetical protein
MIEICICDICNNEQDIDHDCNSDECECCGDESEYEHNDNMMIDIDEKE